jgi:LysM repeat protein
MKNLVAQPVRVATVSVPTASSAGSARATVPAKAKGDGASADRIYTVRAGDTLFSIAKRFNTAVDALLSINKLTARSVIQPGLRLRLP